MNMKKDIKTRIRDLKVRGFVKNTRLVLNDMIDMIPEEGSEVNYATKEELLTKADKASTYTKTEVDNKIPNISELATKAEVAEKADKNTVYTKIEVDTEIESASSVLTGVINQKANTSEVNSSLNLKADKSTTYTKSEVDALIAAISTT